MSLATVQGRAATASAKPATRPTGPGWAPRPGLARRLTDAWPLWAVLVAQAILTARWLWLTAPFSDEALHIQVGHAEWAHWLHGVAMPDYARWFSGAPVIYPPLAAAADSAGGLPAARAVSLIAMFGATVLVYLMGCQGFSRRIGGMAAALFAVSGLIVHYGAFATSGPLALLLLTLAAWAAVRVRDGGFWWLAVCALALVAANAAMYITLLWDPVIFGMLVLHGWDKDKRGSIGGACSVAVTVLILEAGLLMLGGADYVRGLIVTTVFRPLHQGTPSSAAAVLGRAFLLIGVFVLTAALGVIVSVLRRRPAALTLFLCLLVLAAVLAPIDQAGTRQLSSLDMNMCFGLPFAALGAGHALDEGRSWLGTRWNWGKLAASAAAAVVLLTVLASGRIESVQFRGPGIGEARQIVAAVRHGYRHGTYVVSDGGAWMEQYYLPGIPPGRWLVIRASTAARRQRIADEIRSCLVSVIVLRQSAGSYDHPFDRTIADLLGGKARSRPTVVTAGKSTTDVYGRYSSPGQVGGCK